MAHQDRVPEQEGAQDQIAEAGFVGHDDRGGDILNVFLFFLQIFGQDDR